MLLQAVLLIFLCLAIAFYFHVKKCNSYWRKRGVPTVDLNLIFGTAYDFLMDRRSVEQAHEHIYQMAGLDERYVGFYHLLKPGLLIRDPELIHQITVRDFSQFCERALTPAEARTPLAYSLNLLEDAEWKTLRHKMTPIFSSSKLRNMYDLIEECAVSLGDYHFRRAAESREPLDVRAVMTRYGTDVIGKCAFGLQLNTLQEPDSVYLKVGKIFSDDEPGLQNELRRHILFKDNTVLPLLGLQKTPAVIENFCFGLLKEAKKLRSKESEQRTDFLQTMLDLVKNEVRFSITYQYNENHIASNMLVFYVSTYETSSLPIAFALYELAMQPELQEKLRREIMKARDANDGSLDYVSLMEIAYLEMVVSETLRLHPPTSVNFRTCTAETYQIPSSSLKLKSGDVITYSISAIHKDERYFPNPLKFDPERFTKENIARMNPYAYQPFGSGPRMCFGLRFAKLLIKVCLVSLLSRFKVSPCDKTECPIILRTTGGFHVPKNGIWLSVEEI